MSALSCSFEASRLVQAAGQEQDQGAGIVKGFDQAGEGDDRGLAGLPAGVEEEVTWVASL
jgi:hypothetical protein